MGHLRKIYIKNRRNFAAVCNPLCHNGGQCIAPNKCSCPNKYEGDHCEHQMGCSTKPILQNAVVSNCDLDKCTISCDKGYALSNGKTGMRLTCIQRNWFNEMQPTQKADALTCIRKISISITIDSTATSFT